MQIILVGIIKNEIHVFKIAFFMMQETMIVSYSPEHLTTFNLYHQPTSLKPQRNIFGGQKQARSSFEPLCHQPISTAVKLLTDLTPQVHHGLSNAVGEIGGIGVYLFLLGKVRITCILMDC